MCIHYTVYVIIRRGLESDVENAIVSYDSMLFSSFI